MGIAHDGSKVKLSRRIKEGIKEFTALEFTFVASEWIHGKRTERKDVGDVELGGDCDGVLFVGIFNREVIIRL